MTMNVAYGRLGRLLRRPDVRGIAVVAGIKAAMVALNFTLIALAARGLDTVGFGYYSILFSAAAMLLVMAAAGQELFVIRAWSEFTAEHDAAHLKGVLGFTVILCTVATTLIAAAFYPWAAMSFGPAIAMAVTAFLACSAVLQITIHLTRAAMGVAISDGLGRVMQLVPAIVYLATCLITGTETTVAGVFLFLALGSFTGFTVHMGLMWRVIRRQFPDIASIRAVTHRREWLGRSFLLWISTVLEATNQYIDVLILGYLMSPTLAGAYFVTVRLANLFGAAADSITLFATRHFSGLYYRKDEKALDALLDSIAWITIAFIAIGAVGIAAGGYFALWFISPAYTSYFPELLVLCFGTAALAIARPCGSILMLTGNESSYLRIIAGSVALRVVMLFLLTPSFGLMGAVCASAASFILAADAMRRATKATTGLDASLLRLFKRGRAAA